MREVILWTLVFSVSSAVSIVFLGQKDLISGNLLNVKRIISIVFDWRFIISMIFAIFSRFSFMMVNNSLLKLPKTANSATTITAFVTMISMIFIVIANYIFLKERMSTQNLFGAAIIMIGAWFILK